MNVCEWKRQEGHDHRIGESVNRVRSVCFHLTCMSDFLRDQYLTAVAMKVKGSCQNSQLRGKLKSHEKNVVVMALKRRKIFAI